MYILYEYEYYYSCPRDPAPGKADKDGWMSIIIVNRQIQVCWIPTWI